MKSFLTRFFSKPVPRRQSRSSNFGISPETFEDRALLSGVAIYPQPAAAVATESVTPAADPPANFAGLWTIDSVVDGTADIQQEGNQLEIQIDIAGINDDAHGKVKGNNAVAKFKSSFDGGNIKGKITATLLSPTSMEGVITVKIPGAGKQTFNFTGILTV